MAEDVQNTLTKEEAAKRRAEITKFYKDQIPHLKVQAQYEELMTKIEESRAKRLQAQAFLANAYETMESDEQESKESAKKDFEEMKDPVSMEKPVRQLKKT